ncbi:hypothetical protein [Marinifilum caeruleilacunae]|uniref:Uncharacterized protein n=1 Tax=Marinifilum caeruleilacunae TaxID=2499076 RepID=A0ABX1X205_9BACT|nr:hypothetical protein [Marinifilum caeruleilacunae]NOU62349.1 hypothetical protein [Marinifilum caeruleilacunae]
MNKFFKNSTPSNDNPVFKEPISFLSEAMKVFKEMKNSPEAEIVELDLQTSDALHFLDLRMVEQECKKQLSEDYNELLEHSLENGYDFIYFLSFFDEKKDCLCLNVKLFYPAPMERGDVTYSLYLKKLEKGFFLWPF